MNRSASPLRALCVVLATCLLAGCAVLTIDVDVYKGVLSNEQVTQVNQLIALAPASRSLMIQMFNDLPINRKLKDPIRLRLDENQGAVFERFTEEATDRNNPKATGSKPPVSSWQPIIDKSEFQKMYPHDLKGDDLAQQRIVLRLAYIIGLFDDIQTGSSGGGAKAVQLTFSDRAKGTTLTAGVMTLASQATSAVRNPSTRLLLTQNDIAAFRTAMSQVANQIVLLNQFGDFGRIGIAQRYWTGIKSLGRNGGVPSTTDALMLLQAVGNSILAITDELSHRETWDKDTHKRAINDLAAFQKALYSDESTVRKIWESQARIDVESANTELVRATQSAAAANTQLESLPTQQEFNNAVNAVKVPTPPDATLLSFTEFYSKLPLGRPTETQIEALFRFSQANTNGKKSLKDWKDFFTAVSADYDRAKSNAIAAVTEAKSAISVAKAAKSKADEFVVFLTNFLGTHSVPANTVADLFQTLRAADLHNPQQYADEITALGKLIPTLDLPPLPDLETHSLTQSQVTDALVTTLRAYRLHLLLAPSADSDAIRMRAASLEQIGQALAQIEGSRAESIPLRPAGAILRTAAPVTAFQGNPSRNAGNLLTQFVPDAVPVAGPMLKSVFSRLSQPDYNPELEMRLDREFWQPINHIELQGTGDTNYVVIKDDIGNWYVKSYSADPAQAMQSFSKLLGSYYVPLKGLSTAAAAAKASAESTEPSVPLKQSVLEKEQVQDKAFIESVGKLETSVRALSTGAVAGTTFPSADALKKQVDDVVKEQDGKPKERSQALLSVGKDYGLQRLATAAQSKSAAIDDQKTKTTLLDHADTLLKNATDTNRADLQKEKDKAEESKSKADARVFAAGTELDSASAQLDAFKAAAKTFFKERTEQLDQQDTFLREKLLKTIQP